MAIDIGYPNLGSRVDVAEKTSRAVMMLLNKSDDGRATVLNCLHLEMQRALEEYCEFYQRDMDLLAKNWRPIISKEIFYC